MKRILPIAASIILSSNLAAAPSPGNDTISTETRIQDSRLGDADSAAVAQAQMDSSSTAADQKIPRLVSTDDGDSYILADGAAYPLQELIDNYADGRTDSTTEDIADQKLREMGTWGVLGILAICFGFPALVVIVAIVLIIGFLRNRNRERNALIAQAIDRGYQLPDSFYSNQQANGEGSDGASAQPMRDPHKFNSAVTLIAVGLAVGIFFWAVDAPFGFVAGGIPLLIGLG
ncbi:MAG: hypothetical protein K2O33_07610, partial [Muribaculaceae bacterium]|nr:hypothetical protein [Muribaculaceae bacterium]